MSFRRATPRWPWPCSRAATRPWPCSSSTDRAAKSNSPPSTSPPKKMTSERRNSSSKAKAPTRSPWSVDENVETDFKVFSSDSPLVRVQSPVYVDSHASIEGCFKAQTHERVFITSGESTLAASVAQIRNAAEPIFSMSIA